MMANHSPGGVSDADLIRYLDGELDADESERVEAAIAADDTVAGRLGTLSRRDRSLSRLLRETDPSVVAMRATDPSRRASRSGADGKGISRGGAESVEAPHRPAGGEAVTSIDEARATKGPSRRAPNRWMRAAMIIFALLAAGTVVPPVRAWIVDRLDRLVSGGRPDVDVSPDFPSIEDGAPVSYGLMLNGPILRITLDAAQRDGVIEIVRVEGDDGRLEPVSPDAGDPIVITAGEVRIRNAAGSTGGYRLELPATVRTLRVRIGSGAERVIDLGEASGGITLPLSGTTA